MPSGTICGEATARDSALEDSCDARQGHVARRRVMSRSPFQPRSCAFLGHTRPRSRWHHSRTRAREQSSDHAHLTTIHTSLEPACYLSPFVCRARTCSTHQHAPWPPLGSPILSTHSRRSRAPRETARLPLQDALHPAQQPRDLRVARPSAGGRSPAEDGRAREPFWLNG